MTSKEEVKTPPDLVRSVASPPCNQLHTLNVLEHTPTQLAIMKFTTDLSRLGEYPWLIGPIRCEVIDQSYTATLLYPPCTRIHKLTVRLLYQKQQPHWSRIAGCPWAAAEFITHWIQKQESPRFMDTVGHKTSHQQLQRRCRFRKRPTHHLPWDASIGLLITSARYTTTTNRCNICQNSAPKSYQPGLTSFDVPWEILDSIASVFVDVSREHARALCVWLADTNAAQLANNSVMFSRRLYYTVKIQTDQETLRLLLRCCWLLRESQEINHSTN